MPAIVEGHCPMCGGKLGLVGNALACIGVDCPRPTAAAEILADTEIEHILVLEVASFSLRHPLRERLDSVLLTCEVGGYVGEFGREMSEGLGDWQVGGFYRVWMDGDGEDRSLMGELI